MHPDPSSLVLERLSYLDTVTVYFSVNRLDSDTWNLILKGCHSIIRHPKIKESKKWIRGLTLQKPSDELLQHLSESYPEHIITRFDVSLDLITNDNFDAYLIAHYLDVHQTKKWRVSARVKKYPSVRDLGLPRMKAI